MNNVKRPSFQFYPSDWLADLALHSCTVGARGLWIEMICLMHQSSTYGHLEVNHNPIHAPNLARMIGATLQETEGWLEELKQAGVYSTDENGRIYSKRMVRDEIVRNARAAGGGLGGNPNLKGSNKVRSKVNLQANLSPTPSSSSSSSLKEKIDKKENEINKDSEESFSLPDWIPKKLWDDFEAMRVKIKKPMTDGARFVAVAKIEELVGKGYAVKEILEPSILNNWQGIFEPKRPPDKQKHQTDEYKPKEKVDDASRAKSIKTRRDSFKMHIDSIDEKFLRDYETKNGVIQL